MEHPDFGRICECECHWDGSDIFCSCFGQCCEFEQKKFADAEGMIDIARFGALVMEKRIQLRGKERKRQRAIPPFTRFVFPRVQKAFHALLPWDSEKKREEEP